MKYCEDLNLHKIFGLKISLKKALILMNISRNDESINLIEDIQREIDVKLTNFGYETIFLFWFLNVCFG